MPTNNKKPLDLDALLGEQIAEVESKLPVFEFTFGKRQWHATEAGQGGAIFTVGSDGELDFIESVKYALSFVIDGEQAEFEKMIRGMRGLNAEGILALANAIFELVTTRPTEPQPDSLPSPAKKAGPRSTAKSSSQVIDVESTG